MHVELSPPTHILFHILTSALMKTKQIAAASRQRADALAITFEAPLHEQVRG